VIVVGIAIDQDLVRIDGDLRGPTRQLDYHAGTVVGEKIHGGFRIIQFQMCYLGKNGDADLVAVAVIEANAQYGLLGIFRLLLQEDSRFAGRGMMHNAAKPTDGGPWAWVDLDVIQTPIAHAGAVEPIAEELLPRSAGVGFQLALAAGDDDERK